MTEALSPSLASVPLSFTTNQPPPNQKAHPQPWCGKHTNENETSSKDVYNYALKKDKRTPMAQMAELTRFHKLQHKYVLMDESGPSHKKKFTVKLVLQEGEEYEGSGASIKKAQQAAAEVALEKTALSKPPKKCKKEKPEVKIEHRQVPKKPWAAGMGPNMVKGPPHMYNMMPINNCFPFMNQPPGNNLFPVPNCPLPWTNRDFSMMMPPFNPMMMNIPPPFNQPKMDFAHEVIVHLSDGSIHRGIGNTIGFAKAEAATKALFHIRPLLNEEEAKLRQDDCLKPKSDDNSSTNSIDDEEDDEEIEENINNENSKESQKRTKPKSVVSEIHEACFRLKMNVEFEFVSQTGEPHNRKYCMKCRLTSPKEHKNLEAEGWGTSKRAAKQNACKAMIEKVNGLENDPIYLASAIVKQTTLKKSTAKRNTLVKDMKMDPQYGHHVNPISRLIQVMQVQKMPDPVFKLVGEKGQSRYREFIVEVTCMDEMETGAGPNKKLAKRAAAMAMLSKIGYVKPMPQPGKSLLKKKSSDSLQNTMTDIGVFVPTAVTSPESEVKEEEEVVEEKIEEVADIVDVENTLSKELSSFSFDDLPVQPRVRADSEKPIVTDLVPIASQRRRVTFSTRVSECPPPEDANYPKSSVSLLKSEVVVAPKLKKRGKDSKKCLTAEEKKTISINCKHFLTYPNAKQELAGFVSPMDPALSNNNIVADSTISSDNDCSMFTSPGATFAFIPPDNTSNTVVKDAKWYLEKLSKHYRFSVTYSDFPKANSDQYFCLISIGLEKAVLLSGDGLDEEKAHNNAAFQGIETLSQLDS